MSEWIDMDVVRHALGYGIAAVITAVCAWLVAWLKSRTSGALVDKWWEYVRPRVDSAMKKAEIARKDGLWSSSMARRIVSEELTDLARDFLRFEVREPTLKEVEAARAEIEEAMERI